MALNIKSLVLGLTGFIILTNIITTTISVWTLIMVAAGIFEFYFLYKENLFMSKIFFYINLLLVFGSIALTCALLTVKSSPELADKKTPLLICLVVLDVYYIVKSLLLNRYNHFLAAKQKEYQTEMA